jgi:nucleotide-binding universal stress UspA family protein
MNGSERTVLIAYDGSDAAGHAIDEAAKLLPPGRAIVLNVWQRVAYAVSGYGAALTPPVDTHGLDLKVEESCKQAAAEGADRAKAAGLDAEGAVVEASGPIWEAVLEFADEQNAAAIVLGSRGRSGLKSLLLGSVSHAVASHARRPVLIVPPAAGE